VYEWPLPTVFAASSYLDGLSDLIEISRSTVTRANDVPSSGPAAGPGPGEKARLSHRAISDGRREQNEPGIALQGITKKIPARALIPWSLNSGMPDKGPASMVFHVRAVF